MHKITVEQKNLHLKEEEVLLSCDFKSLKLTISGQVYCAFKKFQNQTLEIVLEDNSHLTLEFFLDVENTKNQIFITNGENTKLDFHYSCQYSGENELLIHNKVRTNHNRNVLLVRAVEKKGTLSILATGEITKDTFDNAYLEDIRAITNQNNHLKIMPDLLVSSNSVLASHNATIGPIEEDALFYLESKGLDRDTSASLIKEGFLKGNIKEEIFKNI